MVSVGLPLPLVALQSPERDPSRHPLFQVMFSLESFGGDTAEEVLAELFAKGETSGLETISYTPAKFDISLFLEANGACICGHLNYAVSLFDQGTVARWAALYQRVLRALVADQKQTIAAINWLSEEERQTVLIDWNKTQAAYPRDETLVSLFEQQVEKHPNATALVFEKASLTYAELNARANEVAYGLRQTYQEHIGALLKADTLIALYLDRSIEMVVSILGVLKAGGAYVPLSPEYPQSRVEFILEDTEAPILLCQSHYQKRLKDWASSNTNLTTPLILNVDGQPNWLGNSSNPTPISGPQDLAYVIYTSGTTGQPKGVLIEHHNVVRLLKTTQSQYAFDHTDVWPQGCLAINDQPNRIFSR